jgi:SPOR domain
LILLGAIWTGGTSVDAPVSSRSRATRVPETTNTMADDSRFRFPRRGDSSRRAAAEPTRESEHPNDPLAELARLIGKNDPYTQFGLNTTPRSNAPEERYSRDERYSPRERYAGERHSAPAHSEHDETHSRPYETAAYEDNQQSYSESYDEPQDEAYRNPRSPSYQQPYQDPYQSAHGTRGLQGYDTSREHYRSEQDYAPADPDPTHPEPGYDPRLHQWRYEHQAAEATSSYDDEAHAEYAHPASHHEADGRYGHDEVAHESDHYADEEAALDPGLEQIYDDPPQAHRRGGLATALALIGCAMLGTAGAYAYRSFHGPQVMAGPPPVIAADYATPTKIVPTQVGDAQAGKSIQDRIADAGREQVVSKQEEPVAEKDLGTQAVPRVVLPAPVAPMPVAPQRPPMAAQQAVPAVPGAPATTEPRKVHTVTIRPDGTEMAAPAPGASRGVAPASRVPSGPMSLDPQAQDSVTSPAPKPRVAAAPPPAVGGASGGLMVQLSSQKSEAEAAASFRSLQAKFPDQLADRSPIIRRADLGSKGVFYRTMVGPFASAQEASQFCASYKAAGGQCVVPSN